MIVLSLDTCLGACSAALVDDDLTLGARFEPMIRGHQERLAPMVRELAADAGIEYSAIDRIAVTVGPGSFTGLRVGLAFAKGLSLALDRPCAGVGALEALAASVGVLGLIACVIDAGRGNIYLQMFEGGRPLAAPEIVPRDKAAGRLARSQEEADLTIVGPGARLFADLIPAFARMDLAAPSPEAVARLGLRSPARAARPLYLRPPDAERPR